MRIIFAGSPEFALPCLRVLVESQHDIVGVYTQPDRPSGRGRKLTACPVAAEARATGLPVFQPESLRHPDAQNTLAALEPDLMIVIAYGQILPRRVLDTPRLGCVNVHASLLPRWRGAAPIQRAILAGDQETGVTLMKMDEGLDTGDVLRESTCPIHPDDTAGDLHDRLAAMGAELLRRSLAGLMEQTIPAIPQSQNDICYAHKLSKQEARIDWQHSAAMISRAIRAYNPWPVAHTQLDDQTLRLWLAQPCGGSYEVAPGTLIESAEGELLIVCGSNAIRVLSLQWPGGRRLDQAESLQSIRSRNLVGRVCN